MQYRVASIFCGCGGADRGIIGNFQYNDRLYSKLPFNVVYANDIDQKAINTYKRNFDGGEVVCDNICNIASDQIPDHDILVGGFPCQSFSTVNPTKDPFDDRANLYKQMVRIAENKQPMIFVAENVKGFMTLHNGKIYQRVKQAFQDTGYIVESMLINAADFGVPQRRERVFMIGIRKQLSIKWSFPKPTTPNRDTPLSVAVPSLEIADRKYYFSDKAVQGMKNAKNNMKRGLWQNLNEPCLTITSHLAKVSINSRDPVLLVRPDEELYRRFTPQEAAAIQTFPKDFVFSGSESDTYRQVGNAIPPVLSWHIFNQLANLLASEDHQVSK